MLPALQQLRGSSFGLLIMGYIGCGNLIVKCINDSGLNIVFEFKLICTFDSELVWNVVFFTNTKEIVY